MSTIMLESDNNNPPILNQQILLSLIIECYNNLHTSFTMISEDKKIKIEQINQNFNNEQIIVKEMINFSSEVINRSLADILSISTDESSSQLILNLYQNFISLYGCLSLNDSKFVLFKHLTQTIYVNGNIFKIK